MTQTANYDCDKRQTRLLVREGAPIDEIAMSDSNKNLVLGPRWGLTPDWPTDRRS
jgi:hypothetical protein